MRVKVLEISIVIIYYSDLASAHLVAGEGGEDAVVLLEAVAPREHVGQIYPQSLRHQLHLL